jgi:signal peptidase I
VVESLARLQLAIGPGDRGYRIISAGMETTLHCPRPGVGCTAAAPDWVLVRPYRSTAVRRGDIVAFGVPTLARVRCGSGGTYIKRVVGLPGDRVGERNGHVIVNGSKLAEPYVRAENRDFRTIAPVRVPVGRYYVLGDNRSSSCDSRVWGTVSATDVFGKAIAVYWPRARARRL